MIYSATFPFLEVRADETRYRWYAEAKIEAIERRNIGMIKPGPKFRLSLPFF